MDTQYLLRVANPVSDLQFFLSLIEVPGSCRSTYLLFKYIGIRYMCLASYGASEAVNLCSRYVEKSTKCS